MQTERKTPVIGILRLITMKTAVMIMGHLKARARRPGGRTDGDERALGDPAGGRPVQICRIYVK